jgi:hypothetical protein
MPGHTPRLFVCFVKVAVSWNDRLLDTKAYAKAVCLLVKVPVCWNERLLDAKAYARVVL